MFSHWSLRVSFYRHFATRVEKQIWRKWRFPNLKGLFSIFKRLEPIILPVVKTLVDLLCLQAEATKKMPCVLLTSEGNLQAVVSLVRKMMLNLQSS